MAHSDNFSITRAKYSPSYAFKYYKDYKFGKNVLELSEENFEKICEFYNDKLDKWDKLAQDQDTNMYELTDEEFEMNFADGKKDAAKSVGYERTAGKTAGQWTENGLITVGGIGSAYAGVKASGGLQGTGGGLLDKIKGIFSKKTETPASGGNENVPESNPTPDASKETKLDGSTLIACGLALATGIAYEVARPNKEEAETLEAYQSTLAEAQGKLQEAQADMTNSAYEVEKASDEADRITEERQIEIEEEKGYYDTYKRTYDYCKAKIDNGEALTEDENTRYQDAIKYMTEAGVNIETLNDLATDEVQTIHSDMTTYQESFTNAQEDMAYVQGQTDYSASFDNATKVNSYIQMGGQGLNVVGGLKAGGAALTKAAASGVAWWQAIVYAIASAAGFTGAGMSALGVTEQLGFAQKASAEIDTRKMTEDLNINTEDVLAQNVEIYDANIELVENLEIATPDDVEAPNPTPSPTPQPNNNQNSATNRNDDTRERERDNFS